MNNGLQVREQSRTTRAEFGNENKSTKNNRTLVVMLYIMRHITLHRKKTYADQIIVMQFKIVDYGEVIG